jgi:hypothetical protein
MATTTARTSPLLAIAPEIRNRIYHYIASSVKNLKVNAHDIREHGLMAEDHHSAARIDSFATSSDQCTTW